MAQLVLGGCYENGSGVSQDHVEAVKWYHKAAEQGHAWAQYNLGNCYGNGQGVPQSHQEAKKWLSKAAEQGYAEGSSTTWVSAITMGRACRRTIRKQ